MQRITFKRTVFLVLLVTGISLIPTAIAQTETTESNLLDSQTEQGAAAKLNEADRTLPGGNGAVQDADRESTGDDSLNTTETIESLRSDLDRLREELNQAAETPSLFGINLEIIIAAAALLVSVVSILVSWFLFRSLDQDFKRIRTSLHNFEQQIRLKFGGMETEQERLTAQLKADMQSVQKKQDVFEATSSLKNQETFQAPASSSSFTTSVAADLPASRPASRSISDLIRAVNCGDRQVLREATTAELNITNDSENAIAMGMSQATVLEEVAGGGSYLLVSLQGRNLLFPTDRTLRSFSTTQPNKGLYSYEQQSVAKAEMIEPAVLEKTGSMWRVSQIGKVACP